MDTMGNLLAVVVHAANIHDTKAGIWAAKLGAEAIGTASNLSAGTRAQLIHAVLPNLLYTQLRDWAQPRYTV